MAAFVPGDFRQRQERHPFGNFVMQRPAGKQRRFGGTAGGGRCTGPRRRERAHGGQPGTGNTRHLIRPQREVDPPLDLAARTDRPQCPADLDLQACHGVAVLRACDEAIGGGDDSALALHAHEQSHRFLAGAKPQRMAGRDEGKGLLGEFSRLVRHGRGAVGGGPFEGMHRFLVAWYGDGPEVRGSRERRQLNGEKMTSAQPVQGVTLHWRYVGVDGLTYQVVRELDAVLAAREQPVGLCFARGTHAFGRSPPCPGSRMAVPAGSVLPHTAASRMRAAVAGSTVCSR